MFGALLGDALGDPRRYGLDAAAAAAFLGLVWPRLGTRIARAAAGLAIGVTLGRSPFVPAGLPVLAASVVRFALKLVGHLLPSHWLAELRVARTAALVTVALLAVLVGVQTFTTGHCLVLDPRQPAIVVAVIALALRAPVVIVVVAAATTAAVLRALGMP